MLLFLFVSFVSCTHKEKSDIPRIDRSLIKMDDLIWDLDLLELAPEFEYLDSTSKVREILFKGPDHYGKTSRPSTAGAMGSVCAST